MVVSMKHDSSLEFGPH